MRPGLCAEYRAANENRRGAVQLVRFGGTNGTLVFGRFEPDPNRSPKTSAPLPWR